MRAEDFILRSMLFVPAFNRKFIEKALSCEADALILDMEDSVPPVHRQEAREILKEYFAKGCFRGKNVFIRINEMGSKDFVEDIKNLIFDDLTGFMPSKVCDAGDIVFLDRLLEMVELDYGYPKGKILLTPLIENASAVNHVEEIAAASERMLAICFGAEDYLNSIGCTYIHLNDAIQAPRSKIVNAARAAEILPIDTPYLNLPDDEGYWQEERMMYQIGFAGHLLINPKQIELANKCFSPAHDEIVFSEKIIEAVELAKKEKKSGVAVYEGTMIGPPMIKRAKLVLKRADLIKRMDNEKNE